MVKSHDIRIDTAYAEWIAELKHRYRSAQVKLDIIELHQGCRDKIGKLREMLKSYGQKDGMVYDLSSLAYIGDDLLDLQCIEPISPNGGFIACPADAVDEVKEAVGYICKQNAGNGAVRELIDLKR